MCPAPAAAVHLVLVIRVLVSVVLLPLLPAKPPPAAAASPPRPPSLNVKAPSFQTLLSDLYPPYPPPPLGALVFLLLSLGVLVLHLHLLLLLTKSPLWRCSPKAKSIRLSKLKMENKL